MDDVSRLCVSLAFLILSFLFRIAHVSFLNVTAAKLKQTIEQKGGGHKTLLEVLDFSTNKEQARLQSAFVFSTAFCFVFSFSTLYNAFTKLSLYKELSGYSYWFAIILVYAVVIFITGVVVIMFGYIIPNRVAKKYSEGFLIKFFPIVHFLEIPFLPIFATASVLGNIVLRLFGFKKSEEDNNVTEEEIRSLVEAGEESGNIEEEEMEMINNIFDFDDITVGELMTHRTDIVGIRLDDKISDVIYYAVNKGFSRMPVFEEDIDNIIGILNVKDLLCLVGCKSAEDFYIKDFIREALYVPEAQKCVDLFKMFKLKKAHIAVVVDDYGGTAGIISMEDLLESIVGNIQDEYDNEHEQIQKLDDDTYILDGLISIEDFEDLFDVEFDIDDDWDTLNGLITNTLGKIPNEHEKMTLELEGILFTVLAVEDRRILKVKAQRIHE